MFHLPAEASSLRAAGWNFKLPEDIFFVPQLVLSGYVRGEEMPTCQEYLLV